MTVQNENPSVDGSTADADLILRTRSGDTEAFGELWRRHYPSGISVARSITSSIDPDDLVQEAYTRIYQAILKGGGPNGSFRAYLFTSIRNTAAAWGRARRESAIDELDTVADPDSTDEAANEALDRSLTAQAFRSLPSRWQEVLWYTEIEGMKPAEVGPLLGMKAGAVSQLAFRAREGLREAWIQAHLNSAAPGSECQWTIQHLGAYSRGNLGTRDRKRLETHLDECARCMIVAAEAKDVSNRLALVLLPLVLGVTGATGYLAALQGGGTPIVAMAAMPSSVVEGAVVVGGAAGSAAGSAAVGGAGATSGGAGSASGSGGGTAGAAGGSGSAGGATGGALTGIGALVGAGSAALVVAGVVAAATIVPGLLHPDEVTSLPSAGEAGSSAITSEVAPDDALDSDETFVIDLPEEVDEVPPLEDQDEPRADEREEPGATDAVAPIAPQDDPPDRSGDDGAIDPGMGPGTGTGDSDGDPGTGTGDPGTGTGDPGPGTGTDDPGTGDPGAEPGEDPAPSEELVPLTVSDAATVCLRADTTTIAYLSVVGTPNAVVQALISDRTARNAPLTLDADGYGVADFRPNLAELTWPTGTSIVFTYVDEDRPELEARTTLAAVKVGLAEVLRAPVCADEAVNDEPVAEDPAPTESEGSDPVSDAPEGEDAVPTDGAPEGSEPIAETTPEVTDVESAAERSGPADDADTAGATAAAPVPETVETAVTTESVVASEPAPEPAIVTASPAEETAPSVAADATADEGTAPAE